jgi:hypothetical protein
MEALSSVLDDCIMRRPYLLVIGAFVAGGLAWAAGAITELGSVASESSDPAQRARVVTDVPGWVSVAKPLGLTMMAAAVLCAVILRLRKK